MKGHPQLSTVIFTKHCHPYLQSMLFILYDKFAYIDHRSIDLQSIIMNIVMICLDLYIYRLWGINCLHVERSFNQSVIIFEDGSSTIVCVSCVGGNVAGGLYFVDVLLSK